MKRPNAVGFCPRCDEPVAACCPVPHHGLHLLLSVATLGLWLPVWVAVSVHSSRCRCLQCGRRLARIRTTPLAPDFFDGDPPNSGVRLSPSAALHSLLISNNLVYYMPTAAVRR